MERNIFIVNASQVVVSQSHPEGVFSPVDGYPKRYDSKDYNATEQNPNGDQELALIVAKAEFADRVKQLALAGNRAMWAVTLEMANGRQIDRKDSGAFPDMTPVQQNNTQPTEEQQTEPTE